MTSTTMRWCGDASAQGLAGLRTWIGFRQAGTPDLRSRACFMRIFTVRVSLQNER